MTKYQFKIRARGGVIVDNVTIAGRDQPDAERKLTQMYQGCAVIEVKELEPITRQEPADIDNIMGLLQIKWV
jgi:hypothetical protein